MEVSNEKPAAKARWRQSLTCLPCRKRKVKCDFGLPCGQCKLRGKSQLCEYGEHNRWGYSKTTANAPQAPQFQFDILKSLKESNVVPDVKDSNKLLNLYSTNCQDVLPLLDLRKIQELFENIELQKNITVEDMISLLLFYAISCRIAHACKMDMRTVEYENVAELEQNARQLVASVTPFQVNSVSIFKACFFYACYIFWADSPFYYEVNSLIGLLRGVLNSNQLDIERDLSEHFGIVENLVASFSARPTVSLSSKTIYRDDLFMKCRHMLLKIRERVLGLAMAENRRSNIQGTIDMINEIHNAGGTFGVIIYTQDYNGPRPPVFSYQLLVIEGLSNYLCMLMFRPYTVTGTFEESSPFRQRGIGMAVTLLNSALEYFDIVKGQFSVFAFNDIFMGAFQAAILLAHDHLARQQIAHLQPDTPQDYRKFGMPIPPRNTPTSKRLWQSTSPTWRLELIKATKDMFGALKTGPTTRTGRAEIILEAIVSNSQVVLVHEIFGPFTRLQGTENATPDGELMSASFSLDYFTKSIFVENSLEFEQQCFRAVTEPDRMKNA